MKNQIVQISYLLLFCLVGAIRTNCQDKHIIVVEKYLKNRSNYTSLSYNLKLQHKSFSEDDTLNFTSHVELRKENDSLFGGQLIIDFDTMWLGYDGEKIMKASIKSSTIIFADPVKYPGAYIKGSGFNDLIDYGFLTNSESLKSFILDSLNRINFMDTLINGSQCLGIMIKLPDDKEFYNSFIFVALDTIGLYIKNRSYSVYYQGNGQYTEWTFSNFKYHNDPLIAKLQPENIAGFNSIIHYERDTSFNAIKKEFDYSTISGNILTTGKEFLMKEVKLPLIVLDFWYSSCYPCIKSIPALNEVAKAYTSKQVVVYGINMIDDMQKSKSRLDKFLGNNPMKYETVMIDPDYRNKIYVQSYPTLIILDGNYKEIYREEGFNENLFKEVSEFLDEKLK